jgi:hypothetical protein
MAKIASVDSGSWATISELVFSNRAVLSNIRASHSVETPSCLEDDHPYWLSQCSQSLDPVVDQGLSGIQV